MESNYHEGQSINSSDDHEINQENCDSGLGRSYECVFCKRGFNTAQALGGHMNIHRKDRARKKPMTSNDSNKRDIDDIYTDPRLCQQIPASSYCNTIQSAGGHRFESHNDRQENLSYATYFPASSSITRSSYGAEESDRNHPQPLDPVIHGDRSMSVGLELSQRIMEDLDKKGQVMNQKEELDLELRLGYD